MDYRTRLHPLLKTMDVKQKNKIIHGKAGQLKMVKSIEKRQTMFFSGNIGS